MSDDLRDHALRDQRTTGPYVPLMDGIERDTKRVLIPGVAVPLETSADVVVHITDAAGFRHRILMAPEWCIDPEEDNRDAR